MIYLYIYLAIGLVIFFVMLISSKMADPSIFDQLDALNRSNRGRKQWFEHILEHVVAPALVAVVVTVGWPYALYIKCKTIRFDSPEEKNEPEKEKELKVSRSAKMCRSIRYKPALPHCV